MVLLTLVPKQFTGVLPRLPILCPSENRHLALLWPGVVQLSFGAREYLSLFCLGVSWCPVLWPRRPPVPQTVQPRPVVALGLSCRHGPVPWAFLHRLVVCFCDLCGYECSDAAFDILGFSHDMYPFMLAHVTSGVRNYCFPTLLVYMPLPKYNRRYHQHWNSSS